MRKLLSVSILLLVCGCSLWGKTLRIATYNVENYLITNRWHDGKYRTDYPKPEVEKEALRRVIKSVNPDILVLQEMGDEDYLSEFQTDLKSEGIDYPYANLCEGADYTRHVAILSKEPFVEILDEDEIIYTFKGNKRKLVSRGLMQIDFETNGVPWTLYGLHLKSMRTMKKDDPKSHKQRLGEAVAIRDIIKRRFPKAGEGNYMVMGDFNDMQRSKPLKRFLKSGKRKLTKMLPASDSRGEVWTQHQRSQGVYSRIDFMLVSPKMWDRVQKRSASIVDAPSAKIASDHRMVYADVDF